MAGVNLPLIKIINNHLLKKFKIDFTFLNIVNEKNMVLRLKKRKKLIDMINLKKFLQKCSKWIYKII